MTRKMLQWYILFAAILFAPLFMLATTPYAFGCDSGYSSMVQCVPLAQVNSTDTSTPTATITDTSTITATITLTPTATISDSSTITTTLTITPTETVTPTATPAPTWTPFPTPVGDSPATARDPIYVRPDNCIDAMCPYQDQAAALTSPANWTWIDANSSTWYRINDDYGLQVEIWLFANGQKGLAFDVYAPEQKDFSAKPVGRGSFNKSQANIGADLFYSGRTWAYGTWYVRVNNGNSIPVSYSIRFTDTIPTLGGNTCDSCHKIIGYNWASCSGSQFCSQLHQLYNSNPSCYNHNVGQDLSGGCQ